MPRLFALSLAAAVAMACTSAQPNSGVTMPAEPRAFVDAALKKNGDLGVYGDLREGLDELEKVFHVRIDDRGSYYEVDLGPRSGAGHDFNFRVAKKTGEISEVAVGEVIPEPE